MRGYYCQLISDNARNATSLFALTKKDVTWEWTDDCEESFQARKVALFESTVMGHPSANDIYILLCTYTWNYAFGDILYQLGEQGIKWPIEYLSA